MTRHVPEGMKVCSYCAEEVRAEAIKCRYCGETLDTAVHEPPAFGQQLGHLPSSIYHADFDVDTIPRRVREAAAQHALIRHVPIWAAIVASIVTFNLFFVFNYAVKHERLPKLTSNDPSGLMGAALLFVPLVNIYWVYFCWIRLSDRINFQLKLRELPASPNRWLPVFCVTLAAVGWMMSLSAPDLAVFIFALNWLVLVPLFVAQLQGGINDLVSAGRASES